MRHIDKGIGKVGERAAGGLGRDRAKGRWNLLPWQWGRSREPSYGPTEGVVDTGPPAVAALSAAALSSAGTERIETAPEGVDPAAVDPAAVDPAAVDPAAVDPAARSSSDASSADRAQVETAKFDTSWVDVGRADLAAADEAWTETAGDASPAPTSASEATVDSNADAWYRSLDLRQRHDLLARGAIGTPLQVDPQVDSLLRRWRRQPPFDEERWFVERLARDGFDVQGFPRLLSSTGPAAPDLPEKVDWQRLEGLYAGRRSRVAVADHASSVEPLLLDRAIPTVARLTPRLRPGSVLGTDPSRLTDLLIAGCRRPLADVLDRATDGWLAPGVGLAPAAIAGVFRQLPVLARQLQVRACLWVEHGEKMLQRLDDDWAKLLDTLLDGEAPGAIVALDPSLGPRRRGGQSRTRVTFADGRSLIYRPHCLSPEKRLKELVAWLSRRAAELDPKDAGQDGPEDAALFDLRLPRLLEGEEYGWMEEVGGRPLSVLLSRRAESDSGESRLSPLLGSRLGSWTAIWHWLGGQELIRDNGPRSAWEPAESGEDDFLWVGDHPMPVDAGRFLAPDWNGDGEDKGDEACPAGVDDRIGWLLPGLPPELEAPFAKAYERCLEVFRQLRDELLDVDGPLEAFQHAKVRLRPRPARVYRHLLAESVRPEFLRDGAERELCFDRLWARVPEAPHLARVVAVEKDHLRRGDMPELIGSPDSRHLWDVDGSPLHEVFDRTALECLVSRLSRLRAASDLNS